MYDMIGPLLTQLGPSENVLLSLLLFCVVQTTRFFSFGGRETEWGLYEEDRNSSRLLLRWRGVQKRQGI